MRGIERRLLRWREAGLIDEAAAQAILAHERQTERPILVWSVASLALFALALGILLVIGANWDRIDAYLKLGVMFTAIAAAAAVAAHGWRNDRLWLAEASLFALCALTLGGIALQGQIYQQTAPLWQPLAFWTLLCAPALLTLGRTWLTGSLLALMLGALMLSLAMHGTDQPRPLQSGLVGIAGAIPFLLVAGAASIRREDGFTQALDGFGMAYILLLASLAHFSWSHSVSPEEARAAMEALVLPVLACLLALAAAGQLSQGQRRLTRTALIAGLAAAMTALLTPHGQQWYWVPIGLVLFCAMWGAIILAAAANREPWLYRTGFAAIAIRLGIVYFELFGSLAWTGTGFIAGGLIVLLALVIWRRTAHRWPRREGNVS